MKERVNFFILYRPVVTSHYFIGCVMLGGKYSKSYCGDVCPIDVSSSDQVLRIDVSSSDHVGSSSLSSSDQLGRINMSNSDQELRIDKSSSDHVGSSSLRPVWKD